MNRWLKNKVFYSFKHTSQCSHVTGDTSEEFLTTMDEMHKPTTEIDTNIVLFVVHRQEKCPW